MNLFLKIVTIFFLAFLSACDIKLKSKKTKEIILPKINCPKGITFTKQEYTPKSKEIILFQNVLKIIDNDILDPSVKVIKESVITKKQ